MSTFRQGAARRYQAAMFLSSSATASAPDIDAAAYALDADAMEALSREQPGFISFKSYVSDNGEVVALSEWIDEAAALAWRRVASHAQVQAKGRTQYYESYTLFAGTPSRVHHFQRDEA